MLDAILYNSPIGTLYVAASDIGLLMIKFHPTLDDISKGNDQNEHILKTVLQLDEYFKGERTGFDITLDWTAAPDFYKQVWIELQKIPYGQTVAYSDIANRLNNPKAVRAVGMANGKNPIPIIVPCHRVIGKSGRLHGFTGGLDLKERLLHIENPSRFSIQQVLF